MNGLLFSGEFYVADLRKKEGYRSELFEDLNVMQLHRKLRNTIMRKVNITKCPKGFKSELPYISTDLFKELENYILECISIRENNTDL